MKLDVQRTSAPVHRFNSRERGLRFEHCEPYQRFDRIRQRAVAIGELGANLLRLFGVVGIRDALCRRAGL